MLRQVVIEREVSRQRALREIERDSFENRERGRWSGEIERQRQGGIGIRERREEERKQEKRDCFERGCFERAVIQERGHFERERGRSRERPFPEKGEPSKD